MTARNTVNPQWSQADLHYRLRTFLNHPGDASTTCNFLAGLIAYLRAAEHGHLGLVVQRPNPTREALIAKLGRKLAAFADAPTEQRLQEINELAREYAAGVREHRFEAVQVPE
jgi:hypothetical protein